MKTNQWTILNVIQSTREEVFEEINRKLFTSPRLLT